MHIIIIIVTTTTTIIMSTETIYLRAAQYVPEFPAKLDWLNATPLQFNRVNITKSF